MRYLKPALFWALTCLFTMSSGAKEVELTEGVQCGNLAPKINLQEVKFRDAKFVLLQFWAGYDARSRMLNTQMHNTISRLEKESIQLISVSFDEDRAVFEGIVKADHLDPATQYHEPKGKKSEIFKAFRLKLGLSNCLINSKGIIVARNVNPKDIPDILNKEIRDSE